MAKPNMSPRENLYYKGQGELYIGPAGGYDPSAVSPVGFRWLGDVSGLNWTPNEEATEVYESWSGLNSLALRAVNRRTVSGLFTTRDFSQETLRDRLRATFVEDVAGSVVDESIGNPPLNEMIPLAHQGIADLVITDSASTPNVLPADQYEFDRAFGELLILDKTTGGPYVAPFRATYSYSTRRSIVLFKNLETERYRLRFKGKNTATVRDDGKPIPSLFELYSVEFPVNQELGLISDDVTSFPVAFTAHLDPEADANAALGQFGRIVTVPEGTEDVADSHS